MYNDDDRRRDRDVSNFFFRFGPRFSFLGSSPVVPFVEGAFQLDFFDACYPDPFGYEGCWGYATDVTVGFQAGAGLAFALGPLASLDLGLDVVGTTEGDVLDVAPNDQDFWFFLGPRLGFTLYY